MDTTPQELESPDVDRVLRAIRFIEENRLDQPSLDDVAEAVHLSPYHFQRLFTNWAGVSPKRFMSYLTLSHAKRMLQGSASVLEAALDSGLSGPSRLHDLFVTFEAMTPGEAKGKGANLLIRYGIHDTPFGPCLVGLTDRGICRMSFLDDPTDDGAWLDLSKKWPQAGVVPAPEETGPMIRHIFYGEDIDTPVKLHVTGTNFQVKVWEALVNLPLGRLITYAGLAEAIGHPRAARAVGNACNKNPIAFCIPCHAVVPQLRNSFDMGCYAWGPGRREAIIGWEAARAEAAE